MSILISTLSMLPLTCAHFKWPLVVSRGCLGYTGSIRKETPKAQQIKTHTQEIHEICHSVTFYLMEKKKEKLIF